jgi:hypothetical protein
LRKITIPFFFVIILSFGSWGQMINNITGNAFTDAPYFDQKIIYANRIKSIEGTFSRKKEGDIIRATNDVFNYKFDSLGRLESILETKTDALKKDTTVHFYFYDSLNRLVMQRKTEFGGVSAYYFDFDSIGRVVKITQKRDVLDKFGNLKQSFLMNQEYKSYEQSSLGSKTIVSNNYNLPYKEEWEIRNADGYLLERIENFKMIELLKSKKYFYNEKGLLSSIAIYENNGPNPIEENIFKYDALGNLIEKHTKRNGIFIKDLQIIYDNKTQLLGSFIQREVASNLMYIVRFKDYKFY